MQAADRPVQRPSDARLLIVAADGGLCHAPRSELVGHLRPGDLLVANDAATLPASLRGSHVPTGGEIELRLAGRRSLAPEQVRDFTALAFGPGDHRIRTEDRPAPPILEPGHGLVLGPLRATVRGTLGHPRLIEIRFDGSADAIWEGIASHGRPIQYAHLEPPLALWDVWTRVAALPVAFEAPSAGFVLDWGLLDALRGRGVDFATVTLAAGISSTGDPELDKRLPLDEPYDVPSATALAIRRTRSRKGRVVALGTTVARALEHAASDGDVHAGPGLATGRLGPWTTLRVVDAIVTGVHQPGESHYELLRAFASDDTLRRAGMDLEREGYRSHEFGDSVLVERRLTAGPILVGASARRTGRSRSGFRNPAPGGALQTRVPPRSLV